MSAPFSRQISHRDLNAIFAQRPAWTTPEAYSAPISATAHHRASHRIAIACVLIAVFNLAYFGVRLAAVLL